MSRIVIALFACCISAAGLAQEKIDGTLGGMLNGYVTMLGKDCPRYADALADARAKNDVGGMVVTGQLYQTMCVCHPAKARALLQSLPKERLAAEAAGPNSFAAVAEPGIQTPCWAEQFHGMFEGKTCAGFKSTDIRTGTSEAAYCACMKKEVADWPDADTGLLFRQMGPYNAQLLAAKTNKTPKPQRTPVLHRYITSLNRCGGGGEFMD